jgi:hypothetical protein
MKESGNVWETDKELWDFIEKNKRLVGLQISNGQGLDILNALRDIYITIEKDPTSSMKMLTLLATVIYAGSIGEGQQLTDEIQVAAAMEQFESSMKEMLNEEPK